MTLKNQWQLSKNFFLSLSLLLMACTTQNTVDNEKVSPEKAFKTHIVAAQAYISIGNLDRARFHLKRAMTMDKSSAQIEETLGLLHQAEGDAKLAETAFQKAISLDSSYTQARNNYAVFLCNQKRYEAAMSEFRTVTSDVLYSGKAQAYENMGACALKFGNPTQAEAAFNKAVLINQDQTMALLELADMAWHRQDYRSTNIYLDRYFKSTTNYSPRSLWLGIRLARVMDNIEREKELEFILKKQFSDSREYQEYKEWQKQ